MFSMAEAPQTFGDSRILPWLIQGLARQLLSEWRSGANVFRLEKRDPTLKPWTIARFRVANWTEPRASLLNVAEYLCSWWVSGDRLSAPADVANDDDGDEDRRISGKKECEFSLMHRESCEQATLFSARTCWERWRGVGDGLPRGQNQLS